MQDQYQPIGETAGKIYQALESSGMRTLTELQKEIKVSDAALFHQAIGWLAREDKIAFSKKGNQAALELYGASTKTCCGV